MKKTMKSLQKIQKQYPLYYIQRTNDMSKVIYGVYTKHYKIGDKVYWLGHDNVYGFMNGWNYIADKQMVKNKEHLRIYKRIKTIDITPKKDKSFNLLKWLMS